MDKNILSLIYNKPLSLLPMSLRGIRGVFMRRVGAYSSLTHDNAFSKKVSKFEDLKFSIDHSKTEYWNEQFVIPSGKNVNWSNERNILLENLLLDILESKTIPANPLDKESYWSSLQLNWLFFKVRSDDYDIGETRCLIEAVCLVMEANKSTWIYRPFTLSELISNIVKILLYAGSELQLSKKTKGLLRDFLIFILKNIEVYSHSGKTTLNHTNNHVLANVRALFWATKIFNSYELEEIANSLFEKNCLPLFDNGDLDEGSTIYHFIAAQCIFDISYFVEINLLPRVDRLVLSLERNRFLTPSLFPVIGDVSPDPSMICVINDAVRISRIIENAVDVSIPAGSRLEKSSDYEFFESGDWRWILHARGRDKHIQHSHNDYGSPVLVYKNLPLIFDVGRTTYVSSDESTDQTLTAFHSVPQLDGVDQNPRRARDLYSHRFISPASNDIDEVQDLLGELFGASSKEYELVCGKSYQLFQHAVFGGSWTRFFIVNRKNRKEFVIHDRVDCPRNSRVQFRYFIPQRIILEALAQYEFILNGENVQVNKYQVPCNNFYGQLAHACCLEVSSEPTTKHILTTYLRIGDE